MSIDLSCHCVCAGRAVLSRLQEEVRLFSLEAQKTGLYNAEIFVSVEIREMYSDCYDRCTACMLNKWEICGDVDCSHRL